MVLSHTKLKRKRKEEQAARAVNGGGEEIVLSNGKPKRKRREEAAAHAEAVEDVTMLSNGEEALAASGTIKKEKKRKRRELKAGQDISVELVSVTENVEPAPVEGKRKKKEKKKKKLEANEETNVEMNEETKVEIEAETKIEKNKKEKMKKKERKVEANERFMEEVKDETKLETQGEAKMEKKSEETGMETKDEHLSTAEELYDPKKVVVGGMPYYTSEDNIHDYFFECGVISELDCMIFPDTGNFRGIAFVTFKTEDGATRALEYDGEDMDGRFLKIERCKLKPRRSAKDPGRGEVQKTEGCLSAYIGNLSWDVTEDAIKSFFKKSFGHSKIDSLRLSFDKVTGEFQGYGHVDFGDDESLEAAICLNQKPLLGRPLKIAYSVPPKRSFVAGRDQNDHHGTENGDPRTGFSNGKSKPEKKVATCYTCGEEGHKSFLCPKKGTAQ